MCHFNDKRNFNHAGIILYALCLIGICMWSSCTFEAELDKKYYPADEIKNVTLLKQENGSIMSSDNAFFSHQYVRKDEINPYKYYIKKGKPYTGLVELETRENSDTWMAFGNLSGGLKKGAWQFVSADSNFQISGFFKTVSPYSSICSKEWYITNRRDSIKWHLIFDNSHNATIQLKQYRANWKKTYYARTGGARVNPPINPSPLSNSYLHSSNNIRFSRNHYDFVYFKDSLKKSIVYEDRDMKVELNDDKISYLRYYDDSLSSQIVLYYSKNRRVDSLQFVYNEDYVEKTYYSKSRKSKSLVRYTENGELDKLSLKSLNITNIDSLCKRLIKFNPMGQ